MSPIFFLLLVKHSICDLALQGRFALKYPPKSKLQFWHPNGTLQIFYGFVLFAFLDFWLHLLIDWRKSHILKKANVGIIDQKFWIISAIDQILHFTCYYFYVWCFDKLFF